MTRFAYDLHVHSCLSPCGDDESTPNSIAGMAKLQNLDIVALTDHNAVANCKGFFNACERYGLIPVAGMELTTAEDIHLLCLFPTLTNAEEFGEAVAKRRILVKNKPAVFGNQRIVDGEDNVLGEETHLLINATTLSLEEGTELARSFSGAAIPAHIDREANGMLAVLGGMPDSPAFPTLELNDGEKLSALSREHNLDGKRVIVDSDAHNLWSLSEAEHFLELPADRSDAAGVRRALIQKLCGEERI